MKALKKRKPETLLEKRTRELGIPRIYSQPIGANCVLWRLPPLKTTAGGIIIPESEQSPNFRAVLLAWGPKAMDELASVGVELGHVVVVKRFSGWEHRETPGVHKQDRRAAQEDILEVDVKDISRSDDLFFEIQSGKKRYVLDEKTGRHVLERKATRMELAAAAQQDRAKKLEARKAKVLALAEKTTSPAEAATARRLAAKLK